MFQLFNFHLVSAQHFMTLYFASDLASSFAIDSMTRSVVRKVNPFHEKIRETLSAVTAGI